MAAYVAQTKEKLRDSTSNKNPNYPEGVKDTEVSKAHIFQEGHRIWKKNLPTFFDVTNVSFIALDLPMI